MGGLHYETVTEGAARLRAGLAVLTVFITELLAVLCLLWLTVSITEPCCAVLAHTRSCRGVEAAALPMARCQMSH